MSDHHDNHHSTEQKPVSFTVPLIMASVLLFIIVLLLSVCDPKHGKCACKEDCSKECMEKCEKDDHSMHDEHGNEMKGTAGAHEEHATEPREEVKDSTAASEHAMPKDSTTEHHGH